MSQQWNEEDSRDFIDFGDYFVPERPRVLRSCAELIPAMNEPWRFLELACGAGLLARSILEHHPTARGVCLDRSEEMRLAAGRTLAEYSDRCEVDAFELEAQDWRSAHEGLHAVVSSLAVHHLDGAGKRALFRDVHRMLSPGGVFVLFDVCDTRSEAARLTAAEQWDTWVRMTALGRDGNLDVWETFCREEWNMYRFPPEPDSIDKPSTVNEHLLWGEEAGFTAELHLYLAGHALMTFRRWGYPRSQL